MHLGSILCFGNCTDRACAFARAAIDAGLSINFLPWLTLSASILDFGYVNWANEIIGNSDYAQSVEMSADSADGDQLDNFVKTLPDLFKFKAVEPETPA